jgi:hypothetical protein
VTGRQIPVLVLTSVQLCWFSCHDQLGLGLGCRLRWGLTCSVNTVSDLGSWEHNAGFSLLEVKLFDFLAFVQLE